MYFKANIDLKKKKTVLCELQANCKWTSLNLFLYCLTEGKIFKDTFKSGRLQLPASAELGSVPGRLISPKAPRLYPVSQLTSTME